VVVAQPVTATAIAATINNNSVLILIAFSFSGYIGFNCHARFPF
jgi:hypothetical protein